MSLYKILTVGEKEYKLKLTTSSTILDPIMEMSATAPVDGKGNINMKKMNKMPLPSLKYLVTVLWGSLQKYQHGMTFDKVCDLVDDYIENGKTQMDLFNEVMELLTEGGVLGNPEEQAENLK